MPGVPPDTTIETIDGKMIVGRWDRMTHGGEAYRCFVPASPDKGGQPGSQTKDGLGSWGLRYTGGTPTSVFVPGGLKASRAEADEYRDFFVSGAEACRILGDRSYTYLYGLVARKLVNTKTAKDPVTGVERMKFRWKDLQLCRDLTDGGTAELREPQIKATYERLQDPFSPPDPRSRNDRGKPIGKLRDAAGNLIAREGEEIGQAPADGRGGEPRGAVRRSLLDPLPGEEDDR